MTISMAKAGLSLVVLFRTSLAAFTCSFSHLPEGECWRHRNPTVEIDHSRFVIKKSPGSNSWGKYLSVVESSRWPHPIAYEYLEDSIKPSLGLVGPGGKPYVHPGYEIARKSNTNPEDTLIPLHYEEFGCVVYYDKTSASTHLKNPA